MALHGDEAPTHDVPSTLTLTPGHRTEMVAHLLRAFPEEGCGLLIGDLASSVVTAIWPANNVAHSSKLYTVDPLDYLKGDRAAQASGHDIIGVFHSHTHTDPYPSPTDVAQAPDPSWHYVIVSLRLELPSIRSYRIVNGHVHEEPVHPFAHL